MKFLIDENMPLSFAEILREMAYEAVHVFDVGLDETEDAIILEYAKQNQQIIITFTSISLASWQSASCNFHLS